MDLKRSHNIVLSAVLFAAIATLASDSHCSAQSKVHFISVADTISKDIAKDMEANLAFFPRAFVEGTPTDQFVPYLVKGNAFNRQGLLETIASMPINKGDAVVFYYCGHGFYQKGVGTWFRPPADGGATLKLKDIRDAIRARQPRLMVSIVDCCSILPAGPRVFAAPAPGPKILLFSPLCEELLMNTNGDIAINSSKPDEYALCGVTDKVGDTRVAGGSLFSHVFADEMLKNQHQRLSWKDLIIKSKDEVDRRFKVLVRRSGDGIALANGGRLRDQTTQTVWALRDDQDFVPFE